MVRIAMWVGLGISYTTAFFYAVRYLYPRPGLLRARQIFLAPADALGPGHSRTFTLPDGSQALVTNTGQEVVALSNICPHLGCKVHWEARNQRFFCPCHAGAFDSNGIATEGPPAQAGQKLKKYAVVQLGRNLFLEMEERLQL